MKVQDAASKYSWLLIPMSVPFMWLLFPFRRRYNTYDHTVFVTYSLSFMMMLVITAACSSRSACRASPGSCSSCRHSTCIGTSSRAYELGKWSAIMRTMALVTFAFIAAALFVAADRRDRRARLAVCRDISSGGRGPSRP